MNADKSSKTPAKGSTGPDPGAQAPTQPKASDLGLTERRQIVRPLPVPDAVESDGDTDWATFQALASDEPKT